MRMICCLYRILACKKEFPNKVICCTLGTYSFYHFIPLFFSPQFCSFFLTIKSFWPYEISRYDPHSCRNPTWFIKIAIVNCPRIDSAINRTIVQWITNKRIGSSCLHSITDMDAWNPWSIESQIIVVHESKSSLQNQHTYILYHWTLTSIISCCTHTHARKQANTSSALWFPKVDVDGTKTLITRIQVARKRTRDQTIHVQTCIFNSIVKVNSLNYSVS